MISGHSPKHTHRIANPDNTDHFFALLREHPGAVELLLYFLGQNFRTSSSVGWTSI
jgi:hypothetical protein